MNTVILGLGTNMGDKPGNLNKAVHALSLLPSTRVMRASSIYETAPVSDIAQDNFYNAAVEIETEDRKSVM